MFPTQDAHFIRAIGGPDARPSRSDASVNPSEAGHFRDWFRGDVSLPIGMEGSPAQALLWNAMGPETGVKSKLSKPYLEMVDGAEREAKATGKDIRTVLEEFIMGKGKLRAVAAPVGAGLLGTEEEAQGIQ